MRRTLTGEPLLAVSTLLACLVPTFVHAGDKRTIEFNRDIRPILSEKCFQCHGPDASHRKGKLRLDTEEGAKGVLGKPDQSELVARITTMDADKRMPPKKSGKELTKQEIELLKLWIEQGAPYQLHWSFTAPKRPPVPRVNDSKWPLNPVDHFILTELRKRKLEPSPEADAITLVRRIHFDLLGLPPTAKVADDFAKAWNAAGAKREQLWSELVDKLLASPHYGERMAMYWLDLVRYADTVGYHGDQEHHIFPYRDYVIKAFNDNMPFDRFTIEQLAGDLLPKPTTDQLIATGYNRVLQTTHEGGAQDKEYLAIYSADRVRNFGAVWMGATIGCAQCHNHRYDPYTQKDFYRLAAFFADIDERGAYKGPDATPTKRPPEIETLSPLDREEAARIRQHLEKLKQKPDSAAEIAAHEKLLAEIEKRKRQSMITASVKPRLIRVLNRGDWMDTTGEVVTPAVPHFMKSLPSPPGRGAGGEGEPRRATRLDLARWLTSPEHPQTARVFVNRLWYLLHGNGLSKSLEDSGSQGEWPTHPELLDWLAVEFMQPSPEAKSTGWNVKHIIRLMVTSATYRQASLVSDSMRKLDPDNRLYAGQSRFRLSAEMIRDRALVVSGLLVDRLGGRSVKPYQPDGYYTHLNFPKRTYVADKGLEQYRRGVYTHWQRTYLHPMLKAFDAPSREECTAQRPISNTPLAALVLLNDPSFVECARVFAARIIQEGGTDEAARIRWAWREVLSRQPEEREAAALAKLYQMNAKQYAADPAGAAKLVSVGLAPRPKDVNVVELAAWTSVARVLLNLNESITRN